MTRAAQFSSTILIKEPLIDDDINVNVNNDGGGGNNNNGNNNTVVVMSSRNNNDKSKKFTRCVSNAQDELRSFRSCLRWLCVDQSTIPMACLSWGVFVVFTFGVPAVSHYLLACADCDSTHDRPFDAVVQLSLSAVSTLSFLCLSHFVRRYGLRHFLFFDKLWSDSETVRRSYTQQLNRSLEILSVFVVPCFIAESAYKVWWYSSLGSQIPFFGNVVMSNIVACTMELVSWLYRTTVIFLVCVLFRLICHLQILRLKDFATLLHIDSNVASVLSEHLRIRRHLTITSHRFRGFILWALMLVTGSQFASLLILTNPKSQLNVFRAGELALCSITLVVAVLILLRSAVKITHKAQAITSMAAKWHASATLDNFEGGMEGESPTSHASPRHNAEDARRESKHDDDDDVDEIEGEEDDIENSKHIPSYTTSTISFQKRQALVHYFENNRAGVTVFGFILDRTTLHSIFGFELGLVMWLLGKTINAL